MSQGRTDFIHSAAQLLAGECHVERVAHCDGRDCGRRIHRCDVHGRHDGVAAASVVPRVRPMHSLCAHVLTCPIQRNCVRPQLDAERAAACVQHDVVRCVRCGGRRCAVGHQQWMHGGIKQQRRVQRKRRAAGRAVCWRAARIARIESDSNLDVVRSAGVCVIMCCLLLLWGCCCFDIWCPQNNRLSSRRRSRWQCARCPPRRGHHLSTLCRKTPWSSPTLFCPSR